MLRVKKDKEKTFIKNSLKYREYQPPVIHLEFLSNEEFEIAWQIVNAFEGSGVAFACVMQNAINENELNLHTYGIMTELEEQSIYAEIRKMPELKEYTITLN